MMGPPIESLDGKPRCEPVVQGDPGLVVRLEQLGGNGEDESVLAVIRSTHLLPQQGRAPTSTLDHAEVRRALKVPLKEVPSSTLFAATNRDDT